MKYEDDKMLNISEFEIMAKAYSKALKERGFIVVKVEDEKYKLLVDDTFDLICQTRFLLFRLGGFLNTGKLYALTDRQSKKMEIMFDKKTSLKQMSTLEIRPKYF